MEQNKLLISDHKQIMPEPTGLHVELASKLYENKENSPTSSKDERTPYTRNEQSKSRHSSASSFGSILSSGQICSQQVDSPQVSTFFKPPHVAISISFSD